MQIDAGAVTAELPSQSRRQPAPQAPEFPGCQPIPLKREELSAYDGRFEYWDGDTETAWVVCEPTSATHEQPSQRLAGLSHVIAGVRGSPIECYGTMDLLLRNEQGEKWRIMQADESLYLHPWRARLPTEAMGRSAFMTARTWCWRWTTPDASLMLALPWPPMPAIGWSSC